VLAHSDLVQNWLFVLTKLFTKKTSKSQPPLQQQKQKGM
jgi:hypothetical protein